MRTLPLPLSDRPGGRAARTDAPASTPVPGPVESSAGPRRVPVLLPYPFPGPFDYLVPEGLDPNPGDVVLVPLNRREVVGVVWDTPAGDPPPPARLKPLIAVLDTPPLRAPLRGFLAWMANYVLAPPGEVAAMALRVVAPERASAATGWAAAPPRPAGAAEQHAGPA
ncbi:MAG: hypothetical protein KGL52_15860, partial [Rhodospirillales bacterium]|nr:hypothetical protein [Rhodospirillales bacterium]